MVFLIRITLVLLVTLVSLSTLRAQSGCTDPVATNYDPAAVTNNGSCTYSAASVTPATKFNPGSTLVENSGMIYWNNHLWIHNDGGNAASIYEFDTTGTLLRTIAVSNASNNDWEDITQDDTYIYIGDFGNNAAGNRTDLRIYRVKKSDVLASNSVTADIIAFSYEDQTNFSNQGSRNTDFDCEAMIVSNGKIYLFTKQWVSNGTALYELPILPGSYQADKLGTLNVSGLVTGADINPATKTIVLAGYTYLTFTRFIYLLYDFTGNAFFGGNKRKVTVTSNRQTEAITFINDERIFVSHENSPLGAQGVEAINLTSLLKPYLIILPITSIELQTRFLQGQVRLNWDIKPENEFWQGEIQRKLSTPGKYESLTPITKARGSFDDKIPTGGTPIFYRVRAWDRDRKEMYSEEKQVAVPRIQGSRISYAAQELSIDLPNTTQLYEVSIIDMSGRTMQRLQTRQGINKINVSKFPAGVFIVQVKQNGAIENQLRFIKY